MNKACDILLWDEEATNTQVSIRLPHGVTECSLFSFFPINFQILKMAIGPDFSVQAIAPAYGNLKLRKRNIDKLEKMVYTRFSEIHFCIIILYN